MDHRREPARLTRRVDRLVERVQALHGDRLEVQSVLAGASSSSAATRSTRSRVMSTGGPLRRHPELVTEEAEPSEDQVYGGAATPIADGRRTRRIRERAASTLGRLKADERLLKLELLLVGEHDLSQTPQPPLGRDPAAGRTAGARPGASACAAPAATDQAAVLGLWGRSRS